MVVLEDADVEILAKTVGELRELEAWPENLAIDAAGRLSRPALFFSRDVSDA